MNVICQVKSTQAKSSQCRPRHPGKSQTLSVPSRSFASSIFWVVAFISLPPVRPPSPALPPTCSNYVWQHTKYLVYPYKLHQTRGIPRRTTMASGMSATSGTLRIQSLIIPPTTTYHELVLVLSFSSHHPSMEAELCCVRIQALRPSIKKVASPSLASKGPVVVLSSGFLGTYHILIGGTVHKGVCKAWGLFSARPVKAKFSTNR